MEVHLRAAARPSESLCTEVYVPRQPPTGEPRQFDCYCILPLCAPLGPRIPFLYCISVSTSGECSSSVLQRSPRVILPFKVLVSIHVHLLVDFSPARPTIFRHICDMHYSNINVFLVIATALPFSAVILLGSAPHESLGDRRTQQERRTLPIHLLQRSFCRYPCGNRMLVLTSYFLPIPAPSCRRKSARHPNCTQAFSSRRICAKQSCLKASPVSLTLNTQRREYVDDCRRAGMLRNIR